MRPVLPFTLSLLASLLIGGCDRQGEPEADTTAPASNAVTIDISGAWARETVEGAPTGAVYLGINNSGGKADKLVSINTEVADRAELHTHVHEGDMMRMRRIDSLDIAAGETISFSPGGHHVMLFGLKRSLRPGDRFPLDLVFEQAGTKRVEAEVRSMADSVK